MDMKAFGEHLRKHASSGNAVEVMLYPSEWEMILKSLDPYCGHFQNREELEQVRNSLKRQVAVKRYQR